MRFKRNTKDNLDVNLTPLIDVVFLLLIFFMVSTTFMKQSTLSITLPEADERKVQMDTKTISLMIDSQGNYAIDGQVLLNSQRNHLIEALKQLMNTYGIEKQNPALIISADAKAPHQSVVTAMDAAAALGLSNLRISVRND